MEVVLILGLILLNGVFAMAEIALVTARRPRLQVLAQDGHASASIAVKLGEEPTRMLSTVQVGITSIGILNGIVGEAALAQPFALWMQAMGAHGPLADYLATALVVVVITYCTIVLGELVPKRLGQINAERVALFLARPMLWLASFARPFVGLLSGSTQLILRAMGVREKAGSTVTEEDINLMLAEGTDAGVIEDSEHQMVRNLFRLDDRQISSLMVPRSDVDYLDTNCSLADNLKRIECSARSRFPVVRGGWEDVLGVVSARQLLAQTLRGEPLSLTEHLTPPVFVPESLTGKELLENLKSSGVHLAFVIDEYGTVHGIVTLKDVMEAITGEIKPSSPEDAWALQREDGSWLLDGLIPVSELKHRLALGSAPEEERGRYNTLSGMVMLLLGRLPRTADRCAWEDWVFEVVDIDGKRVDKVLATRKPKDGDHLTGGGDCP